MSRIGKMPITVPSGVKVEIDGSQVSVSGAKGKLNQSFHPDMTINMEDNVLTVQRPSDAKSIVPARFDPGFVE